VDVTGLVTARTIGVTTITAAAGGKSGTATVTVPASTLKLIGAMTIPSPLYQGRGLTVTGTVSSNYSLSNVTMQIRSHSATGAVRYTKTSDPNATSFSLRTWTAAMPFNKLPVGTYVFLVRGVDSSGARKVLRSTTFTVKPASTLKLSAAMTIPSAMKQGTPFPVTGLVTSNYRLTRVTMQIRARSATGPVKYGKTSNPKAMSFNLRVWDAAMQFDGLAPGTYVFLVTASDATGTGGTLLATTFTIKANSTLKLTGSMTIPNPLAKGAGVGVTGQVTSNYVLTGVTEKIINTRTGVVYFPHSIRLGTMSFNLHAWDSTILFDKLPAGTYRYTVTAADSYPTSRTLIATTFTVQAPTPVSPAPTPSVAGLSAADKRILANIARSTYFGPKQKAAYSTAEILLSRGFQPAFVAGVLGNLMHEGNTGIFEYYDGSDFLRYMDRHYDYRNDYSGDYIYSKNVITVHNILETLYRESNHTWSIGGSRVGFGLGSIQWTFGRTRTLVSLYLKVNGNRSTISKGDALLAENQMIANELSGQYKYVSNSWGASHSGNPRSSKAAVDAGRDVCEKYEVPQNVGEQATVRGASAERIFSIIMQ